MNVNSTRYSIKIPDGVEILNDNKKGYVLIKGPLTKKLYKTLFQIRLCSNKKLLYVTNTAFKKLPKKQFKAMKKTTLAMLSKYFLEVSSISYKKLNLVGVGYKVFFINDQMLHFKLGFSHNIYYKVPKGLLINSQHSIKLLISGTDSLLVTQTAGLLKNLKKPEPYKGKGILYSDEQIKLKEGKKL